MTVYYISERLESDLFLFILFSNIEISGTIPTDIKIKTTSNPDIVWS